jgi:hypothetical protein
MHHNLILFLMLGCCNFLFDLFMFNKCVIMKFENDYCTLRYELNDMFMLIPIVYPFTLRVRVRVRIFTRYVWRVRVQKR